MKLNDIKIVQTIKSWTSIDKRNCPSDINVARFVREVIPYLEQIEERITILEQQNHKEQ